MPDQGVKIVFSYFLRIFNFGELQRIYKNRHLTQALHEEAGILLIEEFSQRILEMESKLSRLPRFWERFIKNINKIGG
jgi:hypothetical protein